MRSSLGAFRNPETMAQVVEREAQAGGWARKDEHPDYPSGWLGDRLGRLRRTRYLAVPAVAFCATAPLYVLALSSPNLTLTFLALLPPTALGLAWLGPVVAVIQHLVRPGMRATASAVYFFVLNLVGLGLGTWALGALSDALSVRFGAESLRYSILAGTGLYLIAAALLLLAMRWLERDWAE